jgi:hypothetical protein
MSLRFTLSLASMAVLGGSCTKDATAPEAPPVTVMRTYDLVPVAAERSTTGYLLECKRALSDPQISFAQLLAPNGDPTSRIDLTDLPTTIENIAFNRQDIVITDVLPWGDGTYMLAGFAIETERDDRLHAVVYRVDASGNQRNAPLRRFIGPDAELVRSDDLNELYRTRVLAAKTGDGDLVLAARYETETNALVRLLRLPMNTTNTPVSIDHELEDVDHRLQFLHIAPGTNEAMVGWDGEAGGEQQALQLIAWAFGPTDAGNTGTGAIPYREATATSVLLAAGDLHLVGTYDAGFDEPRSFIAQGTALSNIAVATLATPAGRASIAHASELTGGTVQSALNLYEGGVLAPEALRDDRISDLQLATVGDNGDLGAVRTILAGQGARALGTFESSEGRVIIGALHPYLNTEYLHGFYLVVDE